MERTTSPLGDLDANVFHEDAGTDENDGWFSEPGFYFHFTTPPGGVWGPYESYDLALEAAREKRREL